MNVIPQTVFLRIRTFVLFCIGFFFFHNAVYADVLINEVYPKSTDITQTWVELYNSGTKTVAIDRWRIEKTNGGTQSYFFNDQTYIYPKGFLTISYPQSNLAFLANGDSIRLLNEKNELMDITAYTSTIGYNQSIGRTVDGQGEWNICNKSTKNAANACSTPAPSGIEDEGKTILTSPTQMIDEDRPQPTIPIPTFVPTPTQHIEKIFIESTGSGQTKYMRIGKEVYILLFTLLICTTWIITMFILKKRCR